MLVRCKGFRVPTALCCPDIQNGTVQVLRKGDLLQWQCWVRAMRLRQRASTFKPLE